MDLIRAIHDHLVHAAPSLTCIDEPLQSVRVEPRGPIYRATLVYPAAEHHVAVKPMPPARHVLAPGRVRDIQSTLQRQSSLLRDALIPIRGVDQQQRWILMPWSPGRTLEAILHAALRRPRDSDDLVTACLDRTARILAELHRFRAADFDLDPAAHRNREYLPSLARAWRHDLLRRALPAGARAADLFHAVCTHQFQHRLCDRILPADVQPKNQIVSDVGHVTLIDPQFNAGNPAMTLLGFLIALDRLALRHPRAQALRQIDAWKRYLLHAYAACGEPWVIDDVRVLYPWALVRTFDHHAAARPLYRPYLAHIYTRTLRLFFHHLAESLASTPTHALAA